MFINFDIDQKVLYGSSLTIYCGDSDPNTPPGDWFQNGVPLGVYSRSYPIANATFSDDGEYECRRNGTNVFSTPLRVIVYGERWHVQNLQSIILYYAYALMHMHNIM